MSYILYVRNLLGMYLEVSQMIPLKTVYIVGTLPKQSSLILPWYWDLNGPATGSSIRQDMSLQFRIGGEWKSAFQFHKIEPWKWGELTGLMMNFTEEDAAGSFGLYRLAAIGEQHKTYGPAFVIAIEGIVK